MRIDIIKTPTGFKIPQLETIEFRTKKIVAEVDPAQFDRGLEPGEAKSETISRIEAALTQMGKNRLLELKLKHLPKDFVFSEDESDESALEGALLEKYDV